MKGAGPESGVRLPAKMKARMRMLDALPLKKPYPERLMRAPGKLAQDKLGDVRVSKLHFPEKALRLSLTGEGKGAALCCVCCLLCPTCYTPGAVCTVRQHAAGVSSAVPRQPLATVKAAVANQRGKKPPAGARPARGERALQRMAEAVDAARLRLHLRLRLRLRV